mgnify:CR=1 FL=1
MNEDTLASLIGAMLKCSYKDYTFNGFSNGIGKSVGGSKTHKSGYNGDLRYLREDETGGKLNLKYKEKDEITDIASWKELDESRQEKFIQALYDYGWKSFVSQKYGDDKKLLKFCKEDKKTYKHYDHLHIQGYENNFIKILKSYE